MQYETLRQIYYKFPQKHIIEYNRRFNAPFAKHLNIEIHQINRNRTYPAFYQYTEEIVRILLEIDRESHNVKYTIKKLPFIAMNQFIEQCFIEEIQATNDIEGVHSTKREIKSSLRAIKNGEKPKRFNSILTKYLELAKENKIPLNTSKDIRELYNLFILDEIIAEDSNDKPDGLMFRSENVYIKTPTNKNIHQGLYPESEIIKNMDYALNILNDKEIPRLVAISIFHYLFGYIHPFYNGNGRTIRFITTYCLTKEIGIASCIRLSTSIKQIKNRYYKLFENTTDEFSCGELTFFITDFLYIILNNIQETRSIIARKQEQLGKWKKILNIKLEALGVTDKTTKDIYNVLLECVLFGGNGLTVEEIKNRVGVSRNTVDSRLANIPKEHYIKDVSSKAYRYRLNILILRDS